MIAHLQETWKKQNKVTYSSMIQYNYFLNRQIKVFSWSLNIKLSKINRIYKKIEGYSRPEKQYKPIQCK